MQKPWVVEPSLTCCHYDLYVLHSSNLASDAPTPFLLSLLITVFFSLAFVALTPGKGWSKRLVCATMCIHITSHAIPSPHLLPPIPSWELYGPLAERHRWTFSEILRDATTWQTVPYSHEAGSLNFAGFFVTPSRLIVFVQWSQLICETVKICMTCSSTYICLRVL